MALVYDSTYVRIVFYWLLAVPSGRRPSVAIDAYCTLPHDLAAGATHCTWLPMVMVCQVWIVTVPISSRLGGMTVRTGPSSRHPTLGSLERKTHCIWEKKDSWCSQCSLAVLLVRESATPQVWWPSSCMWGLVRWNVSKVALICDHTFCKRTVPLSLIATIGYRPEVSLGSVLGLLFSLDQHSCPTSCV